MYKMTTLVLDPRGYGNMAIRFLQDEFHGNMTNQRAPSSQNNNGYQSYQFVGLMLWYLFLITCCVIPICCGYRRRRLVEARMAQHQATVHRIGMQNLFILSTFEQSLHYNERILAYRRVHITDSLKPTTMKVSEEDLVAVENEDGIAEEKIPQCDSSVQYDVEDNEPESNFALRLPESAPHGGRSVPATCAICLGPYIVNDEVAWSPEKSCQHAFHKDCIIPWLNKADEPECPCCRQGFCRVVWSRAEVDSADGSYPRNEDSLFPVFMRSVENSRRTSTLTEAIDVEDPTSALHERATRMLMQETPNVGSASTASVVLSERSTDFTPDSAT